MQYRCVTCFCRAESHYYYFGKKLKWNLSSEAFHDHVARSIKSLRDCSRENSWRACVYDKVTLCPAQEKRTLGLKIPGVPFYYIKVIREKR